MRHGKTLRQRFGELGLDLEPFDSDERTHDLMDQLEAARARDPNEDVRAELEALRTVRRELFTWVKRWLPDPDEGGAELADILKRAERAR